MTTVVVVPQVPSKYDVIPIHASDIGAYKRCRRYWDWSSPTRTNLRHRVEIFGVNPKLWFGTGIHYALENYYNPIIQRDPVESWMTWFDLQWYGGTITEKELDISYDIKPIKMTDGNYRIRGLHEMLPSAVDEEFMGYRNLGVGMMTFYKDFALRNDNFQIVAAESQFSIPLGFESKDLREESPNYGKMLEVHARGKRDAIVLDYESERYQIIDHKTAQAIGDDYFKKLDRDPQITTYLWASQKEALMFDLPYSAVNEGILQALRKGSPRPPTVLKNGWQPSVSRTTEATTAKMFEEYVRDNNLTNWFNEDEKAQNYYTWLLNEGDDLFIQRETTRRNKYEIEAQDRHIKMVAKEMLNEPAIYPNPTGDWLCLQCQFRAPCLAADDGSDWKGMLADGYELNRDR